MRVVRSSNATHLTLNLDALRASASPVPEISRKRTYTVSANSYMYNLPYTI